MGFTQASALPISVRCCPGTLATCVLCRRNWLTLPPSLPLWVCRSVSLSLSLFLSLSVWLSLSRLARWRRAGQWLYGSCRIGIYANLLEKAQNENMANGREKNDISFARKLGMG